MIPIIPSRRMWKDLDTRQYQDKLLFYDQNGCVWFCDEQSNFIPLAYKGYDKLTYSLRYGLHPKYNDKRLFRIKRSEDYRIFSKVAQHSHKFKRLYNKRSSIERVNGRLDRDFMFENNTIRGLKKMALFVTMSCLTILGFAYAKVTNQVTEHLSSWVA